MPISIPAQYIGKLYTELLGRGADPAGYIYWAKPGCSLAHLKTMARSFAAAPEYLQLPYSAEARVLTLYRGILGRDPDKAGFDMHVKALNSGSDVVTPMIESPEFATNAARLCSTPSIPLGASPALAIGPVLDGATVQARLNALSPGQTLALPPHAIIRIAEQLVIPAGVTLETQGKPATNLYASMARLVRSKPFDAPLIALQPGAVLQHVWVDGQRSVLGVYQRGAYNIVMHGGDRTAVLNTKQSNTSGATSIEARNHPAAVRVPSDRQCTSNTVAYNLVESYSSNQFRREWSDGLSLHCEDVATFGNAVLDATDVGVIAFNYTSPSHPVKPLPQRSAISGNSVWNLGNPAFAALAADPFFAYQKEPPDSLTAPLRSFVGLELSRNLIMTGPDATLEIGLAVGTRPWFNVNSYTGLGGRFVGNTTGPLSINADVAISISGMTKVTVQQNSFLVNAVDVSRCPWTTATQESKRKFGDRVGNVLVGYGDGDIQPHHVGYPLIGCIGKKLP